MNEAGADTALITCSAPECPFTIEYSPRVLEDIRLAIVDAFCSLPRGGAEIGGILMGQWDSGCLRIVGYAPLDCEHAHGPTFTLSPNDESRLRRLLAESPAEFPGLLPVGWYHSHTRSEIFLSDADLSIHERFFPEPWQVALVLKPHMMRPTRGGFFFRETNGDIHSSEAYQEFPLEPQAMRAVPAGVGFEMPLPEGRPRTLRTERNPTIGVPAETLPVIPPESAQRPTPVGREKPTPKPIPVPEPPPQREPEPERELEQQAVLELEPETEASLEPELVPARQAALSQPEPEPIPVAATIEVAPPTFLTAQPEPSRRWMAVVLIVLVGAVIGAAGYYTHPSWLPQVLAAVRPSTVAQTPLPVLGLKSVEHEGQLQITWDREAAAVRNAVEATLEISDGTQLPQAISLDQPHLHNGTFSYGRQNERVDMKLVLQQPDGSLVREVTTFLGKLPERKTPEEDPEVRRQRDELAAQAAKLQKDLEREAARTRKLEKDLKSMKDDIKKAQQRRMTNMLPDGK